VIPAGVKAGTSRSLGVARMVRSCGIGHEGVGWFWQGGSIRGMGCGCVGGLKAV
jgi:hypothetical protein